MLRGSSSSFTLPSAAVAVAFAVAAGAGALGGCSQPIDPTASAEQAALRAREIVHQSGGGVSFASSDDSGLRKLGSGTSDAASTLMGAMPAMMPPGTMSAMGGGAMAMAASGMPSMMTTEEQFDDVADRLRVFLRERILADANIESRTDSEVVYLLRPDPTCRSIPDPNAPDQTAVMTTVDSHCADQLSRLAVRVAMVEDGDGVRLTVLIGPDRLALSAFVVHSDLLAIETDLATAHAASEVINQTLGTDSPSRTQYDALEGRLRFALHKDGERKVTASWSVLSAIHVATRDASGGLGPEVQVGKADPAVAVTADGVNQSLTLRVGFGTIDVQGDWDPKGQAAPNRDLHVAIGGITGETVFTEASDEIVAHDVGVGDVTVDARGARIFDLGLNPQDQHRFALRVVLDGGQPRFEITPRFDLSLGYHLGAVAADLTSAPPSYAVDETYRVDLEGNGATAAVTGVSASGDFRGGVRVGAGVLTLSSNKAAQAVVVPAGKCLTSVAMPAADAHPVLGKVAVVDCP